MLKIVLVEPQIPQNTGSTARLAAATNSELYLIEPLGFSLADKYLKRAGLDYWPHVKLKVCKNWESFLVESGAKEDQLWFFTTKAENSFYDAPYKEGDFLVFGGESSGLPKNIHEKYETRRLKIPIDCDAVRSLNLASSVTAAYYVARKTLQQK